MCEYVSHCVLTKQFRYPGNAPRIGGHRDLRLRRLGRQCLQCLQSLQCLQGTVRRAAEGDGSGGLIALREQPAAYGANPAVLCPFHPFYARDLRHMSVKCLGM
jgi:hypothetical protein